jgi:hypothetical protein
MKCRQHRIVRAPVAGHDAPHLAVLPDIFYEVSIAEPIQDVTDIIRFFRRYVTDYVGLHIDRIRLLRSERSTQSPRLSRGASDYAFVVGVRRRWGIHAERRLRFRLRVECRSGSHMLRGSCANLRHRPV